MRQIALLINAILDWAAQTITFMTLEPDQSNLVNPPHGLVAYPIAIALTIIFGIPLMIRFLLRKKKCRIIREPRLALDKLVMILFIVSAPIFRFLKID